MVGLPGSGKSYWARNHMKLHPEKHYRLLGTEEILTCVIVSNCCLLVLYYLVIMLNYNFSSNTGFVCVCVCIQKGRQSDSRLQQASRCLTDLIKIAARTPGNYILDQVRLIDLQTGVTYFECKWLFNKLLKTVFVCVPSALQCNVLFSARRHKLQLFSGFRRKAVVLFPSADEWRRRLFQHQTTNKEEIPETALLKLQGFSFISLFTAICC